MNKVLNRDQLVEIRDALFELIGWSLNRRDTLENEGTISKQVSERIGQYEEQIRLIADELNSVLLRQVIADINEPGKKILAVTRDLEEAIGTLKSLNDFLGVLAAVISLATTILTAFTTGNPLVLVNVLDQIEALI
jgi:hypothetical protein